MFNFDTHKGLTVKIYIILVCTEQQWALHMFDVKKTLLVKNNKKREAALKNEAGGDEKHLFFLLGLIVRFHFHLPRDCAILKQ